MLLKIDVDPEDIIFNKNGRIIVRVHHYAIFSHVCHLTTVDGSTMEDFRNNKTKTDRIVFVGVGGGISLG